MSDETPCPFCDDFSDDMPDRSNCLAHEKIFGEGQCARQHDLDPRTSHAVFHQQFHQPFHQDRHRSYLRCSRCALVFVPPQYHLDLVSEKAEYDQHQNHPDDAGYRTFLSRVADPLLARLPANAKGLDFGCGPGPALAAMLREAGHDLVLYDPFYASSRTALSQRYQFICATEVVEHLRRPGFELARLWAQLDRGGWLAVMTKLVSDRQAFAEWHYIRDPTHICFFSRATWAWWAKIQSAELEFVGADVILLRKVAQGTSD